MFFQKDWQNDEHQIFLRLLESRSSRSICGVWSVCFPDGLAPVMHLLLSFPPPVALPVVFIAFDNALNLCIKWGHVSIAVFRIPVRILQYLSICLYLPLEFYNFL